MIEKLAEFCKSHNLAFLIEYDGGKLLRLMFVDTYLKAVDQAALVDLVIDNLKTAFQID